MKLKSLMTPSPQVIAPDAPLTDAAALMKRLDVGAIPVCESDRIVGILTDRDITVRAIAEGLAPDAQVSEAMTPQVSFCYEDDDIERCANLMEKKQIRRMPVLNRQDRLVGIISLGDLALSTDQKTSGEVLEKVSQPAEQAAPPGGGRERTRDKGPSEPVRAGDIPTSRPEGWGRQFG
jgi:CBS domain-containing protein